MTRRTFLIALFLIGACRPTSDVDFVPPRPQPIPVDTYMCELAERHLIALNCPEGRPTKRGKPFAEVCKELQDNGIFVNPKCLSLVETCAGVDVCTGTIVAPK